MVATPGRLMDMLDKKMINLEVCRFVNTLKSYFFKIFKFNEHQYYLLAIFVWMKLIE